jgi:hypothetical protein
MKKLLLIPLLALTVLAAPPKNEILTLEWNPSPDAAVAGYKIYYGTNLVSLEPFQLLATVQGRLTTNTVVTVPVATAFLVATAFTTNQPPGTNYTFLESDFSNPVYLKALVPGSNFKVK